MSTPGVRIDNMFGNPNWSQEDSDRLHFLKNAPEQPSINGLPMPTPPYQYRPYPAAIYGKWTDDRRREELLLVARQHQLNLLMPLERERAESLIPMWDSRLVHNDRELKDWLDRGWADHPNDVEKADLARFQRLQDAAAHQAYDDRRMSEKAKAEFDVADQANGDEPIVDLPVPPLNKKRGRPKRAVAAPSAA